MQKQTSEINESSEDTSRTSRIIPAHPESIFQAFSNPHLLSAWWGPAGFTNTFEKFNFNTGGQWHFTMHSPDGKDYWNENRFLDLHEPTLIVIEHVSAPHFVLTVTLQPHAEGTEIFWAQKFDSPEVANGLRHIIEPSNEQNLDRLTEVLRANQKLLA